MDRLRVLIWNLAGYSNSRIVEIANGFVQTSRESDAMAGHSHKAYVDCLESAYTSCETRRCLALLYVCNEILTMAPNDESWKAVLSKAMSKYVPLICALALRHRENNVVLNVMRLPSVWKQHSVFKAEMCDYMKVQCDVQHQAFIEQERITQVAGMGVASWGRDGARGDVVDGW